MSKKEWAVVGAGPAGIAAVGKLIDAGVAAEQIAWIDPAFKVGDFGSKWRNVSSNTKVDLFLQFLNASESFAYQQCEQSFELHTLDPGKTCQLSCMADPLQWVSDRLSRKVERIEGHVQALEMQQRYWKLQLDDDSQLHAKNVILAIGAEPKVLPFSDISMIALEDALDAERLSACVTSQDTVAVFGSSHSAIMIVRELLEQGVKGVINFYLEPLRYAVYLDNWILFDNTGLKGTTAAWAREHLDGDQLPGLERCLSNEANIKQYLSQCNKVIYAVGFERRKAPKIVGLENYFYNDKSGIIAPGLFGFGIAFPESKEDPFGNVEASVGLWKFMTYINRVLPVWMKYGL